MGYGAGIVGELTFTNSTLSNNYATLSGGGMVGGGVITNSTVSGHSGGISTNGGEIGNTILNNNGDATSTVPRAVTTSAVMTAAVT